MCVCNDVLLLMCVCENMCNIKIINSNNIND